MMIWTWIKNKKPIDISFKKRWEGDVAVVYGKTLEIHYLNKTGGQILKLSDGLNTADDIARRLLEKYDVDEEELKKDVVALLRELQWKRLIKLED